MQWLKKEAFFLNIAKITRRHERLERITSA
jgi:hypothetical protein